MTDIPDDLWLKVFHHLDGRELLAGCALTSKEWSHLVRRYKTDNSLTFKYGYDCSLCRRREKPQATSIEGSDQIFESLIAYIEKRADTLETIKMHLNPDCTTILLLYYILDRMCGSLQRCSRLKELNISFCGWSLPHDAHQALLHQLPQSLSALTLCRFQGGVARPFRDLHNLRELDITMADDIRIKEVLDLTNLEALTLRLNRVPPLESSQGEPLQKLTRLKFCPHYEYNTWNCCYKSALCYVLYNSFISFVESIKGLKQLELRSIVEGVDLGRMRHAALEDIRVFVDERGHPNKLVSLASLKQLTMLGIRARDQRDLLQSIDSMDFTTSRLEVVALDFCWRIAGAWLLDLSNFLAARQLKHMEIHLQDNVHPTVSFNPVRITGQSYDRPFALRILPGCPGIQCTDHLCSSIFQDLESLFGAQDSHNRPPDVWLYDPVFRPYIEKHPRHYCNSLYTAAAKAKTHQPATQVANQKECYQCDADLLSTHF